MKKIYLSFAVLISASSFAQKNSVKPYAKEKNRIVEVSPKVKHQEENKITIWSNDFSNSADWVMANNTSDNQNWVISTSTSTTLGYGTGPFVDAGNTVTNENGYALFDSDNVGSNNGNQDATITYAQTIDLTGYNNVVLEFAQRIRKFTTTQTFVGVSIDNGLTWTEYELNASRPASTTYEDEAQANISAVAGGQSAVKVRFRYVGSWDYAWLVDDVKISELPNDDVRAWPVYYAGVNNLGIEYGRTPLSQIDSDYDFGGDVYNFGVNNQTNVMVDGAFTNGTSVISYSLMPGDVLSGDTLPYTTTTSGFNYVAGIYEGVFTVTTDGETSSSTNFADNVVKRNFAITDNVYSQDGIGVHPSNMLSLSSLGSDSFTATTGTVFSTYYDLRSNDNTIVGIEIGIGSSTNAGTVIQVSIIDTTTLFGDGTTAVIDINGNEALSDYYTVTAADVTAGKVTVYFTQPISLNSDGYFASVNTEVNATNNIRILDDQTVIQPSFASMINIIGDASYTNGNAFAIRLLTGSAGINETANSSFEVYPNPANDVINIKLNNKSNALINILDLSGKLVKTTNVNGTSTSINTSDLTSGVYFVDVINGNNIETQKIVIRK